MNRPSFSPAVFIFKWSGNNLKKKNYTTYSYSFTIKKNHLNNNALYIIISNDTFYEKYSC